MDIIKIVRGNTFATRTHVRAFRFDGTEIENFDLSACTDLQVAARLGNIQKTIGFSVLEDNYLRAVFKASMQQVGEYGLEVKGKYQGVDWRFYNRHIVTIVDSNAEAHIPEHSIIDDDYYEVDGAVVILSDSYDDSELRQRILELTDAINGLAARLSPLEGGDFH